MMKRIAYAVFLAGITLASCSKEPKVMSQKELREKTDSIMAVQTRQSRQEARIDLERRIKIEVRVKADSMLNERLHPKVKDTPRNLKKQGSIPTQRQ